MRKNLLYRVTALSLSVFLLAGCGCQAEENETPTRKPRETETTEHETENKENPNAPVNDSMYSFSLYDEDRQYTADELDVQRDFYEYLEDSFVEMMQDSYLNAVYTCENPEALGIIYDTISWGDISIEEMENAEEEMKEEYNELLSFDYDSLNYEGKLIYDSLKEYITNNIAVAKYWYFDEAFSPLNGVQSNIPILLAEIGFNDKEDITNYILLLDDTERYIDDLLEYEKYRSEHYQIFLSDNGAEQVIEQCNEFINAQDNVLVSSFKERIDDANFLSDSEKEAFIEQNNTIVTESVIPAFSKICTTMNDLKGTRAHASLCDYEGGLEYYRALVETNSGYTIYDDSYTPTINSGDDLFCMTLEDLIDQTEDFISDSYQSMINIATIDFNAYCESLDPEYPVTDPTETLKYFFKNLSKDFPDPVTKNFEIKYVPESLEESSSPAFYFTAPIDNLDKNIIYLNGGSDFTNDTLYSTLSHEGVPGHMYQHTYFNSLNPNHIRCAIDFIAYTEGFAMYAETYAFDYSGLSDNTIAVLKANNVCGYGLYSYIDLQVNVNGWDEEDIKTYMTAQGYAANYAGELYEIAQDSPTIYHRYFTGLMGMLELQDYAKEVFDTNYSNKNFNKFLLEIGPTYFELIQKRLEEFAPRLDD